MTRRSTHSRLGPVLLALLFTAGFANAEGLPTATADGELPPAILGKAPALSGTQQSYFPANPKARGYLAEPAASGPHPSVILIHEWNGLVQRVKEAADAFAAEGYVALAADLYSGRTGTNHDENMALVRETLAAPEKIIANLDAAVAFLRARTNTTEKVATIGWCYGGGVALSFALGGRQHDATAIFYGRLLGDPARMRQIDHPIYGTFARDDPGIPVEQVDAFVATLRRAGIENDVHIYDEVEHGFWLHVDGDPETNTVPALDAWRRLKAYLGRVLGS